MNTALLYINLYFDCPHCNYCLDLLNEEDSPETGYSCEGSVAMNMIEQWFNNISGNNIIPVTGTCGNCKKSFTVDKVEY